MSTWYEVKTTEVRTWLVEVEDGEDASDAFDAIGADLVMAEPQEFSVVGLPDEDERETIKRHIGPACILPL